MIIIYPFSSLTYFSNLSMTKIGAMIFYKRDKNFTKIMTDIKGITENINKWK
jgi:hypothetical protein